ncbi:hypothetical protein Scep_023442 [Stephania cephalantha]|uniref:Uncharacterized protein n=1 Tax=Stephania cephalantha TaxID=152367 RepID=A0AAP0EXL7_9MAGN
MCGVDILSCLDILDSTSLSRGLGSFHLLLPKPLSQPHHPRSGLGADVVDSPLPPTLHLLSLNPRSLLTLSYVILLHPHLLTPTSTPPPLSSLFSFLSNLLCSSFPFVHLSLPSAFLPSLCLSLPSSLHVPPPLSASPCSSPSFSFFVLLVDPATVT